MITRIEALNFRCLRHVSRSLGPLQILVGPNASGKTTFIDVVALLGRLVADGIDAAIDERTRNFDDLLWRRQGDGFELAIEAKIPDELRQMLKPPTFDTIRYEVSLAMDRDLDKVVLSAEKVLLMKSRPEQHRQRSMFPMSTVPPKSILTRFKPQGPRPVVTKVIGGNDNFYSEVHTDKGKGWIPAFKLGPRKSALGNLPEDETRFPVATWLKRLLVDNVQRLILNSLLIRQASAPGQGKSFRPDGSNLPWVVASLEDHKPDLVNDWVLHLQTALPDLQGIRSVERPDDRHRYLMLRYRGGLEIPSWMASDGTLRLLALTLPAYLPDLRGVFLIEEPENGIHPRAVETMYQSLSSVYEAQLLLATHSPVLLSIVDLRHLLCFAKDDNGAADIVTGTDHPVLTEWRGETNLGTVFASGVLG